MRLRRAERVVLNHVEVAAGVLCQYVIRGGHRALAVRRDPLHGAASITANGVRSVERRPGEHSQSAARTIAVQLSALDRAAASGREVARHLHVATRIEPMEQEAVRAA